jgi:ribonuclease R
MDDFADWLMNRVAKPDYRPVTLKALSRQLEVPEDRYAEFRAAVKRLIRDGKLDVAKDKTLRPSLSAGMLVGVFRRAAKGFGFVRPSTAAGKLEDIYIPIEATGDACSGDQVAVTLVRRSRRGGMNSEGRIDRIIARASGVFVGTYFEAGDTSFVQVDGTTLREPIAVGDPGAKGARPGDKVAIEMVRFPTAYRQGEGVISEILGQRGQPGVDTLTVIRAFNLPDIFPEEALDQAREAAKTFNEDEIGTRLDLRDLPTVTIDPSTARDFDDAISLSRDEQGNWSLAVHIADVSHFVRAGSALDRAARLRGTSVYLPDRVIPMLPEILSNSLASLQAGRTRYTVSVLLDLNPEGIVTAKRFARTAIKVDHRFDYEHALGVMKHQGSSCPDIAPEIAGMLPQMLELAMILRRRRMSRGALELYLPEIEIELDAGGQVSGAHLAVHDESHQVIEEFMLAANEAVATSLTEHHIEFLRRVHPDPEPAKLIEFAEFVRSLGLVLDQPQSRFELQRVLAESIGQPEEYAVHYGLLRSLKQATYTPLPERHYALASQDYCHFTSPIRRYPDLQVHRQLIARLAGNPARSKLDELVALGEHCTRTERRAEAAERELIRMKLLAYLEDHVGTAFQGIIVGVEDFGLFCRLSKLPVEGLIKVSSLTDDYYYLEDGAHTLVGRRSGCRHRLGDRVLVRVAHVDVDRRALDLVLVESTETAGRPYRPLRGTTRDSALASTPARTAGKRRGLDAIPRESSSKKPRPSPRKKRNAASVRKARRRRKS